MIWPKTKSISSVHERTPLSYLYINYIHLYILYISRRRTLLYRAFNQTLSHTDTLPHTHTHIQWETMCYVLNSFLLILIFNANSAIVYGKQIWYDMIWITFFNWIYIHRYIFNIYVLHTYTLTTNSNQVNLVKSRQQQHTQQQIE